MARGGESRRALPAPAPRTTLAIPHSAPGTAPITSSASCSSSPELTSGHASSRTRSIASWSSLPNSSALFTSSPRRVITAWVRRSSSGASSRNAYGFAFSTSCDSGDGSGVSRAMSVTPPASIASSTRFNPGKSIASSRQSSMVCLTSGWSGISRSPTRFSGHASWSGNTAATRSSASIRCSGVGTFLPPRARSTASARVAFQRHREPNMGASSIACTSRCSAVSGLR